MPYARYGEGASSVTAALEAMRQLAAGFDCMALQKRCRRAARNALDCVLGLRPNAAAARLEPRAVAPRPRHRLYDSLRRPPRWRGAAKAADRALSVKLGGDGADPARIAAVRRGASAMLIVDVNEGWNEPICRQSRPAPAPMWRCGAAAGGRRRRAKAFTRSRSAPMRAPISLASLAALAANTTRSTSSTAGGLTEKLAMAAEAERSDCHHGGLLVATR